MLETLPLGSIYFAWSAAMAVAPIRRPRAMGTASWLLSSFPNELPFVFLAIVAGSNIPILAQDVLSTRDRISLVLAAITVVALVVVVVRALRTRPVVERALTDGAGSGLARRSRYSHRPLAAASPALDDGPPRALDVPAPPCHPRCRTSHMATVGKPTCSTSTDIDPSPITRRRSSTCMEAASAGAGRAGRRVRSSSAWPARDGHASAPTTASLELPPRAFPGIWSM